jgi:predicted transposase/invertase (TIGR01784 family)
VLTQIENFLYFMNTYDRIFKENLGPLIPLLVEKVLHLYGIKAIEELKDKIQVTIERETDYICKVIHRQKKHDYILHIEFQVTDDRKMVRRMFLYRSMLYQKYGYNVKQFVLYLGDKPPTMTTYIHQDGLNYAFNLVPIKKISYENFIKSDKPEEVILAVLADMHEKPPETVITEILDRLHEISENGIQIGKYLIQLKVISKLRNLQPTTLKLLKAMPLKYDIKTDEAYVEGRQEGRQEGITETQHNMIVSFLKLGKLTVEDIAQCANVTVSFVKTIQNRLNNEQ